MCSYSVFSPGARVSRVYRSVVGLSADVTGCTVRARLCATAHGEAEKMNRKDESVNKYSLTRSTWKKLNTLRFSSVAQSCPTLCDPTDCSMPGFPVHHPGLRLYRALFDKPLSRACVFQLQICRWVRDCLLFKVGRWCLGRKMPTDAEGLKFWFLCLFNDTECVSLKKMVDRAGGNAAYSLWEGWLWVSQSLSS